MISKTSVYIAAAAGAIFGGALFRYFHPEAFKSSASSEPTTEPDLGGFHKYEVSQLDIDTLQDQIVDLERMVAVWANIRESYPDQKEVADECVNDIHANIKRHQDAIAAVQTVLNLRAA